MACTLQIKAVKRMQDKGIISSTREILDYKAFDEMNRDMTEMAVQLYDLETSGKALFDSNEKKIRYPFQDSYMRKSYRTIYRAVPNEKLFNQLQNKVDNVSETENQDIQIEIEFPSNEQIVDSENPISAKQQMEKLKKQKEDLDDLTSCIWGS